MLANSKQMNEQMLSKFESGGEAGSAASSRGPTALYSSLLTQHGFRHAFFTRLGGASSGPFASLNFSFAVGDRSECVDANLRLAARTLGVDVSRLYFASQVHGRDVVEIRGHEEQRRIVFTEADAVVSAATDVACAVRTADCLPVLLADPLTGRTAAVHAGWRGLVAHVLEAALRVLAPATTSSCIAAIGPHISATAFRVADDVALQLQAACPEATPVRRNGNEVYVDLRWTARAQLHALGLQPANIDDVMGCTYSDPERFFSYRRDGKVSGRHLSAIVPGVFQAP